MDNGCFQILLTSVNIENVPLNLSGNYKLTLKHAQIHIYPEITEANTIPIEIYSPNLLFSHGPNTLSPTLLYPRSVNNAYQSNLDIDLFVQLNSSIQIQIRNASTKQTLSDLQLAVLTFYYEKI
jgi:hypothetical protein